MLALGSLSSALALFIAFEAAEHGTNLMLWYWLFVVPVGAILIGIIASGGFALGARLFGVRMTGVALVATVALLCAGYLGAEYVGFKVLYPHGVVNAQGEPLGFWGYLDEVARATRFIRHERLGLAGYLFRLLALVGFVAGGVVGPLYLLQGRPHCRRCARYHRERVLAHLSAEDEGAVEQVRANVLDARTLRQRLLELAPPEQWNATAQLSERILCRLWWCSGCKDGAVVFEKLAGLPDQTRGREFERHPLAPAHVSEYLQHWRNAA